MLIDILQNSISGLEGLTDYKNFALVKIFIDTNNNLLKVVQDKHSVFNNPKGYIDYYAPNAGEQLKLTVDTSSQCYEQMQLVSAMIRVIEKLNQNLSTLKKATEQDKTAINNLEEQLKKIRESDISELKQNPAIKNMLNNTNTTLNVEGAVIFNQNLKKVKTQLDLHQKYQKTIPAEGMLNIKRALYVSMQRKQQQLNDISYSSDAKVDQNIMARLDEIQLLMRTIRTDYQELLKSGGEQTSFLHTTTANYWESIYLYKSLLVINGSSKNN